MSLERTGYYRAEGSLGSRELKSGINPRVDVAIGTKQRPIDNDWMNITDTLGWLGSYFAFLQT